MSSCSDEEYTIVFDDDVADDDESESAYLPNVSPIQVRLEEEDFGSSDEPFADLHVNQATPKKVGDDDDRRSDNGDDDDNDDAGIAEAVDTLLKMHPLPSTTKKGARQQQHQTTEVGTNKVQKEEEDVAAEAKVVDEWRNATDPKSGRTYYYNRRTRETRWKLPANAILIPRKGNMMTAEKKKEQGAQKSVSSGHERSSDSTTTSSTARQTKSGCSRSPLNNLNNFTPPRDEGSGLDKDTLFRPVDSATGSAIRPEVAASTPLQGVVTTTPAPPPAAASAVPTHSHSQPYSHHRQRQNADDHSMFCIYCASRCGSIDGMADHLLECGAYMSMLAKHPRAQRRLEDMMLRTWGIKRQVPAPTAEDSFDARLISHSHLGGDGMLDAVASPSIAEHLTPNPAGSTTATTCGTGSSIHRWDRTSSSTPPSAINTRPITASTVSSASANTCTDAFGDQRSMHTCTDPQYLDDGGRTALGNIAHNYYDHEGDVGKNNCCDDDSSSPLRECAFCGRAVENLSRHLLRCKTRQRTQDRRRRASAMASGGHMPGTAIQRVMSGGRSLPGHPKSDKRIDHARRLDYC